MKTLDDGGSQFYQTGLVRKVLGSTEMEYYNGLSPTTKVEVHIRTNKNFPDAKIDWPNSYPPSIGMMMHLESNTISDISFAVHNCGWFTHNHKSSHYISVKRQYNNLQGTKYKGLIFNQSNKMVVYFMLMHIFGDYL